MGACSFYTGVIEAKTAKSAFKKAVADAKYAWGNNGYTGTIAEKSSFIEVELPKKIRKKDIEAFVANLANDPKFEDKWGPAACVKVGPGKYQFSGYASE